MYVVTYYLLTHNPTSLSFHFLFLYHSVLFKYFLVEFHPFYTFDHLLYIAPSPPLSLSLSLPISYLHFPLFWSILSDIEASSARDHCRFIHALDKSFLSSTSDHEAWLLVNILPIRPRNDDGRSWWRHRRLRCLHVRLKALQLQKPMSVAHEASFDWRKTASGTSAVSDAPRNDDGRSWWRQQETPLFACTLKSTATSKAYVGRTRGVIRLT